MRITRLIAVAAWLAAGALLAACSAGGGHPHPASARTGGSTSPDAQTAAIVACYRAHGDPGFPDPVYDPSDGRWHFAISPGTAPLSTQRACRHLFPSGNATPPVPQAQFQQLVRLARCLRQHGLPSWPDPNPEGQFPLPPPLLNKTPAGERARTDCQRLVPSRGLDVIAAP
jgi:hypothetical protein